MKRVVVGLSGGVDSSVAAYLLKEQGYEVIGVTMNVWQNGIQDAIASGDNPAIADARAIAEHLGIRHIVVDFRSVFREKVIDYFVEEYLRGRTPNPCNMCNRVIKWEALLSVADEYEAEYVATGHYAKILQLPDGRMTIQHADTDKKDQTYALYNLTQEQLRRTLMPLGSYEKDEVRSIAAKAGIPVASKKDSQDICFIEDHDYAAFIESLAGDRIPSKGEYVDANGKVLGMHEGITHYTIGQRKGLGLAMGEHVFVTSIDPNTNRVYIGKNEDLFTREFFVADYNPMGMDYPTEKTTCTGKIRYAHKGGECVIEPWENGLVHCIFAEPVRAITPGQAAVFYRDGYIIGGGLIQS